MTAGYIHVAGNRIPVVRGTNLPPKFDVSNRIVHALANNNQLGVIARFNSGFRFNVRGNNDLNRDGIATNDRPLFIGRNTATSGPVKQIDLRYSRFIPVREAMRIEVPGEFTDLFNIVNVSGINQTVPVTVDSANPLNPPPARRFSRGRIF